MTSPFARGPPAPHAGPGSTRRHRRSHGSQDPHPVWVKMTEVRRALGLPRHCGAFRQGVSMPSDATGVGHSRRSSCRAPFFPRLYQGVGFDHECRGDTDAAFAVCHDGRDGANAAPARHWGATRARDLIGGVFSHLFSVWSVSLGAEVAFRPINETPARRRRPTRKPGCRGGPAASTLGVWGGRARR